MMCQEEKRNIAAALNAAAADLEKQLADKDKEIERMRPVVEAATAKSLTLHGWLDQIQKAIDDYEHSAKPDTGVTET